MAKGSQHAIGECLRRVVEGGKWGVTVDEVDTEATGSFESVGLMEEDGSREKKSREECGSHG